MPKVPKNKMVSKQCPKCEQQVPVACKACPCGHVFFITRRPISIHKTGKTSSVEETDGETKRRRTERIKRERPDFYNALEIESQLKKLHRRSRQHKSSSSTSTSLIDGEDGSNSEDHNSSRKGRGRPKHNASREHKSESDPEEELFANVSAAKALQYSVVLSEINRKILLTQFKV